MDERYVSEADFYEQERDEAAVLALMAASVDDVETGGPDDLNAEPLPWPQEFDRYPEFYTILGFSREVE